MKEQFLFNQQNTHWDLHEIKIAAEQDVIFARKVSNNWQNNARSVDSNMKKMKKNGRLLKGNF